MLFPIWCIRVTVLEELSLGGVQEGIPIRVGALRTEKGGTCLFLGEDCCYFVNKMGIVQGRVKELRDRIEGCRKELQNLYSLPCHSMFPPSDNSCAFY